MRRSVLIASLLVSLTGVLDARQWPHWRGPSASGVSAEKGLPVKWSDTEGVAWKAAVRGLGISSPIVSGNLVFVTSQVGTRHVAAGAAARAREPTLAPPVNGRSAPVRAKARSRCRS